MIKNILVMCSFMCAPLYFNEASANIESSTSSSASTTAKLSGNEAKKFLTNRAKQIDVAMKNLYDLINKVSKILKNFNKDYVDLSNTNHPLNADQWDALASTLKKINIYSLLKAQNDKLESNTNIGSKSYSNYEMQIRTIFKNFTPLLNSLCDYLYNEKYNSSNQLENDIVYQLLSTKIDTNNYNDADIQKLISCISYKSIRNQYSSKKKDLSALLKNINNFKSYNINNLNNEINLTSALNKIWRDSLQSLILNFSLTSTLEQLGNNIDVGNNYRRLYNITVTSINAAVANLNKLKIKYSPKEIEYVNSLNTSGNTQSELNLKEIEYVENSNKSDVISKIYELVTQMSIHIQDIKQMLIKQQFTSNMSLQKTRNDIYKQQATEYDNKQ